MAKSKHAKAADRDQRDLIALGENGATPERARHAGEPLFYHVKTRELRRRPRGGVMEAVPTGATRIRIDPIETLYRRGVLAPFAPDANAARYEAGRRYERLIDQGAMIGSPASPNLMGGGQVAPGSAPYLRSLTALDARNAIAVIRHGMPVDAHRALEWCIRDGLTVEQATPLAGNGEVGRDKGAKIYLVALRTALAWLVAHWGMAIDARSRIRGTGMVA